MARQKQVKFESTGGGGGLGSFFERAEAGWPHVEFDRSAGWFLITGRYRPAGMGSKVMGAVFWPILVLSLAACVMGPASGYEDLSGVGGFAFLALLPAGMIAYGIGSAVRRNLYVVISPEMVTLRGLFGRAKYYRLSDIREFSLEEHQRSKKARRFAEAKGFRSGDDAVYRGTAEAVMWYGNRRVPIASFHFKDIEKGESLVRTLQEVAAAIAGALRSREAEIEEDTPDRIDIEDDLR